MTEGYRTAGGVSPKELLDALALKVGFEVVQQSAAPGHLRLVGRVPQARMPDMLMLFSVVLTAAKNEGDWAMDPSKYYFIPDGRTETVFAWRFIFECASGDLPLDRIVSSVMRTPVAAQVAGGGPLAEIKLAGVSPVRNQPNNRGRGAAPMGKAVVGPMRRS